MLDGDNIITRPRGIIGIPRRSQWNPDWAIDVAARAARGNPHPCPVIHEGKILGIMAAESYWSPAVRWKPTPYRLTYTDYNDLISEFVDKGKRFQGIYTKTPSAATVANTWNDMWTITGLPVAATLGGTAATAVSFDDTHASALVHGGNVSTDTKYLLSVTASVSSAACCFMLYDRVLDYESCAYTAAANQAMTNTNTAQRYNTNGTYGCQLTWGCDTVNNATATSITQLQYTNQAGTTLQNITTTTTINVVVSAAATAATRGTRIVAPVLSGATVTWGAFIPLAQADSGARLVDNYTTSAANTGTFVLALIYPLAYIPYGIGAGGTVSSTQIDQLFHISAMERVYDGACLSFMVYTPATTALGLTTAGLTFGWG